MVEDPNYAPAKERLVFLLQNNTYKGRFELLYKLYKKEIHELSLKSASILISKELEYPIGVQTIRSLRKKSLHLKKAEEQSEYSESSFIRVNPMAFREVSTEELSTPSVSDIESFIPIDVFNKEYKKEQSLIQWVKQ